MNTIKPIETHYKGYRFRSRLEARWAVFFDAMNIAWKYEDEGYEKTEARWASHSPECPMMKQEGEMCSKCEGVWREEVIGRYLPDFRLFNFGRYFANDGLFVEIKGDPLALKRDWQRQAELHDWGGVLPGFHNSFGSNSGLILLGDIPDPTRQCTYFHPIIQHHKGL